MRTFLMVGALTVAGFLGAAPEQLEAQSPGEPLQLALFNPLQLRSEEEAIDVLRLSLIYGRNISVRGLDVGLVSHSTGGESKGVQFGGVGYIEGDFIGWQDTAINVVQGNFKGFQSGLYNGAASAEAFQLGVINRAGDASGFQLGLVNYAESMYGLQIGLVNIIRSKPSLPFFPIVNWSF